MATKWVSIKEARLLEQRWHSTIGWAKWEDLVKFIWRDMSVLTKAMDELKNSKIYNAVGKDIETLANKLVDEKCIPEWNRISEEMKPLWDKRNELAKAKAEAKEWEWTEENENELAEIDKKMAELTDEYQKVTDNANKELTEYKDKRIEEEQWACFLLDEEEYKIVGSYAGFSSK